MNVRIFHKSEIAKVQREEWVDTTRRVFVEGDIAYIPVKEGRPFDEVLEERTPYKGRGYQKMGDTILIHGDAPTKSEIEEILAFEQSASGVLGWQQRLTPTPGACVGGALLPESVWRKKLLWQVHPSPPTVQNNGPLPL